MNWKSIILSSLVLLLLLPGCRREIIPASSSPAGPTLEIAIQFPSIPATKAGELQASYQENKIQSLAIWVFRSEDHTPVGDPLFLTSESDFPPSGGIGRYQFHVDWSFVNSHPDVDVFVLANASSIGCTLNASSTYDDIVAASFGYVDDENDLFGTHTYTTSVDPDKGLPMSGMKTHVKVYGSAPQMKVDPVTLVRAVSRLRMVLCKTATNDSSEDDKSVSVSGITFYENQIPLKEYVFTEGATGIVSGGYASDFSFSVPGEIKKNPVPENLIYVSQDPDEYQKMLDNARDAGQLTDLGYVYLRESDKRIFGRVNYTIDGNERSREFAMSAPGDFARNHTWTLFAYFMSGRNLQVSLVAAPWSKGDYHVNFSEQAVNVTKKFRMDERTCDIPHDENGFIKYSADGYIDVKLIPGTTAKGTLSIITPVGGTLMITPNGAASLFSVTQQASINPNTHGGEITIEITNNPDTDNDISLLPVSETTLTLSFSVSVLGREVNVDSEAIDKDYKYRFHL